jgi:cardiolipin synthase
VAVRGPAVTELRAAFLDNWNEAGDWHFESAVTAPAKQPADIAVQVVCASTTIGWTDTSTMLRALISLSRHRLRIVTAYFNPDDKPVKLLIEAALRGVEVQILVPGKYCDSRLSQLAGHQHIEPLLECGVKIWRYERTMLHAKIMTVDGELSCVGSANMNHRSIGKDEECCLIARSCGIAAQLETSFEKDCEGAVPYVLADWQNRGMLLRFKEGCARIFIEQL